MMPSLVSTSLVLVVLGLFSRWAEQAGGTDVSGGLNGLLQYGAIGLVCAWLMVRVETRLKDVERAIDRSTRASLVVHLSRVDISEQSREEAQQILREVEEGKGR
jgi:hypothetical protein